MTQHASSSTFSNGSSSNGKTTDLASHADIDAHSSNGSSNGHRNGKATSLAMDEYADASSFKPLFPGSSIDRRELVKLTLQSLREMGYDSAAKALESESGVTLEHPSITAFRTAVLSGDWRNAERLLIDGLTYAARRIHASRNASSSGSSGLSPEAPPSAATASSSSSSIPASFESPSQDLIDSVLRRPDLVSLKSIRFMIQKQRYLELLEARQTKKALNVLRERLTPLSHDTSQLHLLSSLVISASPEQLHARAGWDGADGESRRLLMMEIESAVSPLVMVPSRRLPQLLEQAQSYQKQQDPFFNQPHGAHFSLLTIIDLIGPSFLRGSRTQSTIITTKCGVSHSRTMAPSSQQQEQTRSCSSGVFRTTTSCCKSSCLSLTTSRPSLGHQTTRGCL